MFCPICNFDLGEKDLDFCENCGSPLKGGHYVPDGKQTAGYPSSVSPAQQQPDSQGVSYAYPWQQTQNNFSYPSTHQPAVTEEPYQKPNVRKKRKLLAILIPVLVVVLAAGIYLILFSGITGKKLMTNEQGKLSYEAVDPDNQKDMAKLEDAEGNVSDGTAKAEADMHAAVKEYKERDIKSQDPAGYVYHIFTDNTIEIADVTVNETSLNVPREIDGLSVTSIGYEAFIDCSSLTTIKIPDSVTSIAKKAFKQNTVSSASIPDSIVAITDIDSDGDIFVLVANPSTTQILEHCFGSGVSLSDSFYLNAGSDIRSAPDGEVVETLKIPIYATGTIEGDYFKFTHNDKTVYADLSVTTTTSPSINGYINSSANVRNAPDGNVLGTLSVGQEISGTLEGNWIKFDYSDKTGYVAASLLQADPVKSTCYIKTGSNIRSAPGGAVVEKLKMPIYVTGTIEGDNLKFTYADKTAYVHLSVTTTTSPSITGHTKSKVNVRSEPNGSVIGSLSADHKITGTLEGNWVKFTYSGGTGYVHSSLLK